MSPYQQLIVALACIGLWMMTLVMTFRLEVALREHAVQMNALTRANNNLAWKLDPHAFGEVMRQLRRRPNEENL